MRRYSIRPTVTMRGRASKGLRGYAGKPFHPPLTDFPIAAYVFAMAFDAISFAAGRGSIGRDFFVSATHVVAAGAIVSVATAITGFVDWLRSTEPGTQARRTANWHMTVMLTVTLAVAANIVVRLVQWHHPATSAAVLVLSLVIGLVASYGAMYGGSLVYEYGFNVETAGDHPAWHRSETDVLPGHEREPAPTTA